MRGPPSTPVHDLPARRAPFPQLWPVADRADADGFGRKSDVYDYARPDTVSILVPRSVFSVSSGAGGGSIFFCMGSSAPRAFFYARTSGSAQTRARVLMRRNPGIRRCVVENENPAASSHIADNPSGGVAAQRGKSAPAIVFRYKTKYRRNTADAAGYAGSRDSLYFRWSVGKAFLPGRRISEKPPSDGRSLSPSLINMANITGPRAASWCFLRSLSTSSASPPKYLDRRNLTGRCDFQSPRGAEFPFGGRLGALISFWQTRIVSHFCAI